MRFKKCLNLAKESFLINKVLLIIKTHTLSDKMSLYVILFPYGIEFEY